MYILKCVDGSYYTGSTTDIDRRLAEHQQGICEGYTASRRPVKLVWVEDFPDMDQAFDVERQIKGWTRAKKEALILGDRELLHKLAECRNATNYRNRTT
ncbi:MAG: GIY-YIG nuclease family protein [Bacteroidota bacterium]